LSVQILDLTTDILFDLTDPHPSKSENFADILKGLRTVLSSDDGTVLRTLMIDPVATAFSLTRNAVLGLDRKTCDSFDNVVLDDC